MPCGNLWIRKKYYSVAHFTVSTFLFLYESRISFKTRDRSFRFAFILDTSRNGKYLVVCMYSNILVGINSSRYLKQECRTFTFPFLLSAQNSFDGILFQKTTNFKQIFCIFQQNFSLDFAYTLVIFKFCLNTYLAFICFMPTIFYIAERVHSNIFKHSSKMCFLLKWKLSIYLRLELELSFIRNPRYFKFDAIQ